MVVSGFTNSYFSNLDDGERHGASLQRSSWAKEQRTSQPCHYANDDDGCVRQIPAVAAYDPRKIINVANALMNFGGKELFGALDTQAG